MAAPSQPRASLDEKVSDIDSVEHGPSATGGFGVSEKSQGVVEMEQLRERMSTKYLVLLYGGFAVLAYTLSLNQYTSSTFLSTAVSIEWGQHSLSATINTVAAVFQAISQPPIAKLADVFGRVNTYMGCVTLYVVGYIIVSASPGIAAYAVGNSIYILGITGMFLLQNIIISDISSLKNRFWWTTFPSIPGAINVWVAGDVATGILKDGNAYHLWRWGFAMYTIMTPVLAAPIIFTLWRGSRPSRVHREELKAARRASQGRTFTDKMAAAKAGILSFFWQIDMIGLILFVAGFGMFFVTITLANSATAKWSDTHSIVLLVIGGLCIIAFGVYEGMYAPHPLLPLPLLRNNNVIGCLLIGTFYSLSGAIADGFLYTFMVVAGDQSIKSATRLTSLPSFAAMVVGIIAALLSSRFRRIKIVVVIGLCFQVLSYGLMIRFRTSTNSNSEIIIVQLLKGVAIGCTTFPVQAMIQASAPHEHLGAITSGYLVVIYLCYGIGAAIGGAIWTNVVPDKLMAYMGNDTMAVTAFKDPFTFALEWAPDTAPRMAVARAQDEAQRTMVIVGVCCGAVALLLSIFMLDNILLPDTQSLESSETLVDDAANARRAEDQENEKAAVPSA